MPDLPLTCLSSAEFKRTTEVLEGQNTVIDFWTTSCTRCPDALDNLNDLASKPSHANVKFVSICCGDQTDGPRNIIEDKDEQPKWENISHYHMDFENKEIAKDMLGFRQVPFYVVLNDRGEIIQSGGKRDVNFENIPGAVVMREQEEEKKEEYEFCMDEDF